MQKLILSAVLLIFFGASQSIFGITCDGNNVGKSCTCPTDTSKTSPKKSHQTKIGKCSNQLPNKKYKCECANES